MRVIKTHVCGRDVDLATTLRVAYQVQGQHNHKPYAEVFQGNCRLRCRCPHSPQWWWGLICATSPGLRSRGFAYNANVNTNT